MDTPILNTIEQRHIDGMRAAYSTLTDYQLEQVQSSIGYMINVVDGFRCHRAFFHKVRTAGIDTHMHGVWNMGAVNNWLDDHSRCIIAERFNRSSVAEMTRNEWTGDISGKDRVRFSFV
jgi:hypothetical protein